MSVSATSAVRPKAKRQHDGRRQRAGPVDRGERHAPLDEARTGRAARQESDAERDKPERDESGDASRRRPSPRPIVAGWSGRRARPAPLPRAPRRRDSACAASPGAPRPDRGSASSPADRARVRAARSRRRAPSAARNASPSAMTPGSIDGASGIGSSDAEQPIDGEGNRRAERRAGERADQRDDRGTRRARAPRRSLRSRRSP